MSERVRSIIARARLATLQAAMVGLSPCVPHTAIRASPIVSTAHTWVVARQGVGRGREGVRAGAAWQPDMGLRKSEGRRLKAAGGFGKQVPWKSDKESALATPPRPAAVTHFMCSFVVPVQGTAYARLKSVGAMPQS